MTDYNQNTSSMTDKTNKPPDNRPSHSSQTIKRSPSTWLKSKLFCHETCTGAQRIRPVLDGEHRRNRSSGGCKISRNRRHFRHSADLTYDPLSYALNFQQEDEESEKMKKFLSRLPPEKNLEDLKGRMEAVEIGTSTAREKTAGRLKNNVFEVRVPRVKTAASPVKTSSTPETGELMVQAY